VNRGWWPAWRGEESELSDARLVAGLRRRAPSAFAGLHDQYAAGIYSLALRMVRHVPDAEDITQDVLIRAYERIPREGEVSLRPWLYRLTLNCCYDHLRASARRRPAAVPTAFAAGEPISVRAGGAERELTSPGDPFEQSELQRVLEAALDDVTLRQRAAILLKDVHGLTLVEVAACLDLTPGSVEVLLARARKAFRTSFAARYRADGRAAPQRVGALASLPLFPLPPSLQVAVPPVLGVPLPAAMPPVAVAAGGGIGAALGVPASLKAAALIVAAAATMGTAEVATNYGGRPPAPLTAAAASAPASANRAPIPAPTASPAAPTPAPTPSPSAATDPSPSPTPYAITSPTPEPGDEPDPSPSPRATTEPTPDPSPSADDPSPGPSPEPTPSLSPTLAPSPSPSPSPSIVP